jgi:hypothetical protein
MASMPKRRGYPRAVTESERRFGRAGRALVRKTPAHSHAREVKSYRNYGNLDGQEKTGGGMTRFDAGVASGGGAGVFVSCAVVRLCYCSPRDASWRKT